MRRKWTMLFRFGMTVVVFSGLAVYYMNNFLQKEETKKRELVRADFQFENKVAEIDWKDENIVLVRSNQSGYDFEDYDGEVGSRKGGEKPGKGGNDEKSTNKKVKAETLKENEIRHEKERHSLKPVIEKKGGNIADTSALIHLSVVACGDRGPETLILLKSAVLLSASPLVFYIFAEEALHKDLRDQLEFWPAEFKGRVWYKIFNISIPSGTEKRRADEWLKLFKLCASQRLFIPDLLTDVDSVIYVDTDVLFVSPLDYLWKFFSEFNATQLAALAPEHEEPTAGWYNRFARHPYYGPLGVNSGVMLMNLTRMRQTTWLADIKKYHEEYRYQITWGDQDLINIYFHFHPGRLYLFSCDWNYRPDHCMYMSNCKPAKEDGAKVLHGARRVMHNEKQPAFKAVYDAFRDHRFGASLQYDLLERMKKNLKFVEHNGNCASMPNTFMYQLEQFVFRNEMRQKPAL
ncbi:hypothetical protein BaRGS_00030128 [Batillaria attramentaria]|uniref:UDP-D-xylose:beta-D-glucoside alpha-1,3-D-xylosyltransferase n=1 Tax=Batillaria attramentaria TaxID=370345 RepID=A0ABD0JU22_9CAEN